MPQTSGIDRRARRRDSQRRKKTKQISQQTNGNYHFSLAQKMEFHSGRWQHIEMITGLIICIVVALANAIITTGKIYGILEQIRLLAMAKGEAISPFYACRGCGQHIEFGKKYAPELMKKIRNYEIIGALIFFTSVFIAIAIASKMK